jgi:DNA-binding response OmpR family regulator
VLYVEDFQLLLTIRTRGLRNAGFRVLKATTAEDALELLRTTHVDVVVADLRLPGRDGIALLEEAVFVQAGIGRVLVSGALTEEAREWAARNEVPVVLKGEDAPEVLVNLVRAECRNHGPAQ